MRRGGTQQTGAFLRRRVFTAPIIELRTDEVRRVAPSPSLLGSVVEDGGQRLDEFPKDGSGLIGLAVPIDVKAATDNFIDGGLVDAAAITVTEICNQTGANLTVRLADATNYRITL
jgi:hypothetical protein